MPADTYDSTLGLIIQGTGNNNNSWGDTFNNSMLSPTVRAIAGINTISDTSGTVNLDDVLPPAGLREDIDYIQRCTGITSSLTVEVTNKPKTWLFWNNTAFLLYVKVNGGTATQIPAQTIKHVICDGAGNVYRVDAPSIGDLVLTGKAAADYGTLLCNGASLLRAEYPDLFSKIDTTWGSVDALHFTLPDFVTNNRFLRAAGGSLAVATTQSSQNKAHTHTGSGTTAAQSVDHTHTYSGSTGTQSANHTHSEVVPSGSTGFQSGGSFAAPFTAAGSSTGAESANHTHAYSGTTSGVSQGHTHTYSFTTASDGGTEARPENAAVLICIRY
jgi:microcystin-dependent protein